MMKGDLLGTPTMYEHLIKMEAPSHDLVDMDDPGYPATMRESITYVDTNRDESMQMGVRIASF